MWCPSLFARGLESCATRRHDGRPVSCDGGCGHLDYLHGLVSTLVGAGAGAVGEEVRIQVPASYLSLRPGGLLKALGLQHGTVIRTMYVGGSTRTTMRMPRELNEGLDWNSGRGWERETPEDGRTVDCSKLGFWM